VVEERDAVEYSPGVRGSRSYDAKGVCVTWRSQSSVQGCKAGGSSGSCTWQSVPIAQ
jgi:hypothetical protein